MVVYVYERLVPCWWRGRFPTQCCGVNGVNAEVPHMLARLFFVASTFVNALSTVDGVCPLGILKVLCIRRSVNCWNCLSDTI